MGLPLSFVFDGIRVDGLTYSQIKNVIRTHGDVTAEQRAFVGWDCDPPRTSNGWRQADQLESWSFDGAELGEDETSMLAALMAIEDVSLSRERLEFLS